MGVLTKHKSSKRYVPIGDLRCGGHDDVSADQMRLANKLGGPRGSELTLFYIISRSRGLSTLLYSFECMIMICYCFAIHFSHNHTTAGSPLACRL